MEYNDVQRPAIHQTFERTLPGKAIPFLFANAVRHKSSETTVGGPCCGSKDQITGEVAGEVMQLLLVLAKGAIIRADAQAALALKGQANFRKRHLGPALAAGLIEMTVPDKPRSRNQRYRLTALGRKVLAQQNEDRS